MHLMSIRLISFWLHLKIYQNFRWKTLLDTLKEQYYLNLLRSSHFIQFNQFWFGVNSLLFDVSFMFLPKFLLRFGFIVLKMKCNLTGQ